MHSLKQLPLAAILALATAMPAAAEGVAGPYLATRHAGFENDYAKAAEYATRALLADPANRQLLDDAISAYVGLGRFDRARPFAERLADAGADSQLANLVLVEQLAQSGAYEQLIEGLGAGRLKIAPLVDGLVKGWAQIGAGRMSDGLATFDEVAAKPATRVFGLYHKAMALAMAGDYEAAAAILGAEGQSPLALSRRGVLAQAEILSQLERNDEALAVLTEGFGPELDPAFETLAARLEAGEALPMTVVRSANDGLAEVFFSVAAALNGDTPQGFVLAFSRTAETLNPQHLDALLLSAGLLDSLRRFDLAVAAYDKLPAASPYFYIAELGRAEALEAMDKHEDAIAVLKRLSETNDDIPQVFVTLGDALRRAERYAEAGSAYDRAIALFGTPSEENWGVYFARGITQEREKNWDRAEADFRMALKLKPDQPQVLNYLGYSFVEMQRNLDEALEMIERAVAARPDDGYITDSLGWVFYRLGRFEEAVVEMERAAALMPVDPVINDHLGDVYWAVGRKREAQFQWRRAMSFDPEEKDAARIRRKLEVGLDAVLKEEGAQPLAIATDG